tara:strand:- start:443 stop:1204 length:762 start_codon:yes stop_codon:yes gene_type:complete
MSELQTGQQEIFNYVKASLGDGMIEVELDPNHYETALERAINRYRQRSSNAVEESYSFLTFKKNQNKYILPDEVINVRSLNRRTVGSRTEGGEGGTLFEPFNLAYTNTYMLRAGATGGLATYYAFASYQEMVGKMFGSFIQHHYDVATKTLTVTQRPRADDETVLMHTDNFRPDITLFKDIYAKPWIRDYTLAVCKTMLGEARGKFSTIAGPQGGTTLNGDALKNEGNAEMERLDNEIGNFAEGGTPHSFVIG